MDKYIYFVTQLPTLLFDQKPLISIENFLIEAEKWLTEKDLYRSGGSIAQQSGTIG